MDAFRTGEISEQQVLLSRESDVMLFAAGHQAIERYGVRAVGELLASDPSLLHRYLDISNAV